MNRFLNTMQWFYYWLMAYFIITFPQLQNYQSYGESCWYNEFDNFIYNDIGLRYDSLSRVYRDLWSNEYSFDHNQQTYYNIDGMRFDNSGISYSCDKRWAIDFFGNHYHWCPINNCFWYSGWWSSDLLGVKRSAKPVTGPSVAAHVFLFKNHPFVLPGLKRGFTALVVSSFFLVNPIRDLSMIGQKPPELEPTRTVTEVRFKNLETLQPTKATLTQPLATPTIQKQTRVAASQINPSFDLNSQVSMLSVNPSTHPRKYDTLDLLQDLRKCLDVHTEIVLTNQTKHGIELNPSLETGIRKLYKQLDTATHIAREKQKWLEPLKPIARFSGESSIRRLQEDIQKHAFDQNGNTITKTKGQGALNRMVAKQLREHSRFPLSGIKTLVDIKHDPQAALTPKEQELINQEFAITPDGQEVEPLTGLKAHILPDAWRTMPRGKSKTRVLGLQFPFERFPYQIINNNENFVTTPVFLEKIMDRVTKMETGLLPKFIQIEYNPAWRPEKNYLIANAISQDFYLPALSENEKRLVLQKRLNKSKKLTRKSESTTL